MSKKIILISLDWTRPKDPPQSLGHASILAYLLSRSINVIERSWSVNDPAFNVEDVIRFIDLSADEDTFIAFGAFVWNEAHIQEILFELNYRRIPGKIVVGGPQISYLRYPQVKDIEDIGSSKGNVLELFYPHADIFIRGYAEIALAKLMLSTHPHETIPGVHYKGMPDLNSLGEMDIEGLYSPLLSGVLQPKTFLRWETKRGCPFKCAFCQHKSPERSRYYQFPIERVIAEAEWIAAHPNIQDIAIVDPTFNIKKTHYLEVLHALIRLEYSGKLSLQCRAEFVTSEFLELIQILNQRARVVLEFGLQTINEEEEKIIQRPNHQSTVSRVLNECLSREIEVEVSLIYGLPLQTVDSFIESVQFLVDIGAPIIRAWPLMLLRGTKLYEEKHLYGLEESDETIPHVIKSNSFTTDEYRKMQTIADSLSIYNQLSKEEQDDWEVGQQKTHTASLSYARSLLFFREHRDLVSNNYLTKMRHFDPVLQRLYDEQFGIVLSG